MAGAREVNPLRICIAASESCARHQMRESKLNPNSDEMLSKSLCLCDMKRRCIVFGGFSQPLLQAMPVRPSSQPEDDRWSRVSPGNIRSGSL